MTRQQRSIAHSGLAIAAALACLFTLWQWFSHATGGRLVPSLPTVGAQLLKLAQQEQSWRAVAYTLSRGILGLSCALVCAISFGTLCGRIAWLRGFFMPFVAILQACPTIIWLTLLLVWAGTGSILPILVVFSATFPPLFANTLQAYLSLDHRLFAMAALYHVPWWKTLRCILLPGITPYVLAGLSYAASMCWKVVVMAEFIGAKNGIGAQIFWAYRMLDMPALLGWACVVTGLGMLIELGLITPLRQRAKAYTFRTKEPANAHL